MPYYIVSPFHPTPKLLVSGQPEYVFGSFNDRTGPTLGYVISDSGNGTTSTVKFQVVSGNLPVVGALVTIIGTANASGGYNVTNVAIVSVSTPDSGASGVVTITFLNTANSGAAVDFGQVEIPQPVLGEAIVAGASYPIAFPFNNPNIQQGRTLSVKVTCPTIPTALTIQVQESTTIDKDSEYVNVGSPSVIATSAFDAQGGLIVITATAGRFYRVNLTGLTGNGTIAVAFLA